MATGVTGADTVHAVTNVEAVYKNVLDTAITPHPLMVEMGVLDTAKWSALCNTQACTGMSKFLYNNTQLLLENGIFAPLA